MIYLETVRPQLRSPNILWDNVLGKGMLVASSADATGPAANALAQATNNAWVVTLTSATLTVTLGAAAECDMAGFAAHTLTGRAVAVQYWDGAAWVTRATVTPTDNGSFMVAFDRASSTQWRISVSGGAFRIGVAYLGAALMVPGTIQPPHTPLHLCEEVEIMSGVQSRTGQFLGADVAIFGGKATMGFEAQYPDFVLNGFEAFRQWFNRGNAFFIASAPNTWPLDMGYCWRNGGEIVPPWRDAVFMSLAMDVGVYRG